VGASAEAHLGAVAVAASTTVSRNRLKLSRTQRFPLFRGRIVRSVNSSVAAFSGVRDTVVLVACNIEIGIAGNPSP